MGYNIPANKGYSLSQIPSTPSPSSPTPAASPTTGKLGGIPAAAPPPKHVKEVAERAEPPAHEQMNEFGEATIAPHSQIAKLTLDQEGEPPRAQTPNHRPSTERPLSWAPADHYAPTPKSYAGGPIPNSKGVEIVSDTPAPASQPPQVGPSGNLKRQPPQRPLPPTPTLKASPTTTVSQAPRQESRPPLTRSPGLKPPPGPLPKPPEGVAPFSAGRGLPTLPASVPNRPVGRSASAPPAPSTALISPSRMTAAQLHERTQEAQMTGTYDAELHQAIRTKLNDLAGDADLMAASSKAQEAYEQLKEANITLSKLAPTQQATPPTSTNPPSPGPKSAPESSNVVHLPNPDTKKDIHEMSEEEKKELRDAGVDISEIPTAGAGSSAPTNVPRSVNQEMIPETTPQPRTRAATAPPPVTYSTAAPPPSLNAEKSKQLATEIKELRTRIDSRKYAVRSVASKILRFGDPKLKLEAELRQKQIEHRCLNLPEAVIRDFEADPNDTNLLAFKALYTVLKDAPDSERLKDVNTSINTAVEKLAAKRSQAVQKNDAQEAAKLDKILNQLPADWTKSLRQSTNALSSTVLDFDKPGEVMTPEILQFIGSQGLTTNYDGTVAVSHESYGTVKDKTEKEGRNCDRAFGEKTPEGNFRFGVFDGSGANAHALKTASICMSFAQESMNQNVFAGTTSKEDCAKQGKSIFESSINPETNPAIRMGMGYVDDLDDPTRTNGQTTAIILETEKKANNTVVVRGAALGDCSAFAITAGGCQVLYKEASLHESGAGKDVGESQGQLSSPSIDTMNKETKGKLSGEVEGIYAEVNKGSVLISASDALTDNLNKDQLEEIIQFIAFNSAFDTVPTNPPPPNIYNPETHNVGDLHKPTLNEMQTNFGSTHSPEFPKDSATVAQRLNNYVAWIAEGQKKNMETYNQLFEEGKLSPKSPTYDAKYEPLRQLFRKGDTGKLDDATVVAVQV